MTARVTQNGAIRPLDAATLGEYMKRRGYDPGGKGVAVALNDQVVPRSEWESTALQDGDRLEIVEPVQGG